MPHINRLYCFFKGKVKSISYCAGSVTERLILAAVVGIVVAILSAHPSNEDEVRRHHDNFPVEDG